MKMPSYQYREFHCGDKMAVRSSYLHKGGGGGVDFLCWKDDILILNQASEYSGINRSLFMAVDIMTSFIARSLRCARSLSSDYFTPGYNSHVLTIQILEWPWSVLLSCHSQTGCHVSVHRPCSNGNTPPLQQPQLIHFNTLTAFYTSGGRLNKKDCLTSYGNSHVKDKTS